MNFTILKTPFYQKNCEDKIDFILDKISPKKDLNQNTKLFFSKTWCRNYFTNFKKILDKDKTNFLFKDSFDFTNKKILFVGASPVLDFQLEWIKKNKDSFYIFSSDTSSNTLIQNKIIPDYIISIDPSRGTIYHFKNIPENIPIITWFGGSAEIFHFKNPILIFLSNYPLDQILGNTIFHNGEMNLDNPSLNVSGVAKAIAIKFNAEKFLLSGVSFQKFSGKTHSRGTGYENYFLDKLNRKISLESYTPITYKEIISKKNELALYHLTDSLKISVEYIGENLDLPKIEKNKFLSIKITEKEKKEFLKTVSNLNHLHEISKSLNLNQKKILRYISNFNS